MGARVSELEKWSFVDDDDVSGIQEKGTYMVFFENSGVTWRAGSLS